MLVTVVMVVMVDWKEQTLKLVYVAITSSKMRIWRSEIEVPVLLSPLDWWFRLLVDDSAQLGSPDITFPYLPHVYSKLNWIHFLGPLRKLKKKHGLSPRKNHHPVSHFRFRKKPSCSYPKRQEERHLKSQGLQRPKWCLAAPLLRNSATTLSHENNGVLKTNTDMNRGNSCGL